MLMGQLNFGMHLHVSIFFFLLRCLFNNTNLTNIINLNVQVQDYMSVLIFILYKIAFVQMY